MRSWEKKIDNREQAIISL